MPDPGALYAFDIFMTRAFVRDGLTALFPDQKDKIGEVMAPGEYGVESYYCRLLCIFVFVLGIADEFQNIINLFKFLWHIPTEEGFWVQYDSSKPSEDDDPHGTKELEKVQFKVAGMPVRSKFMVLLFIVIPRIFIWRMLTLAGVHFLMETAAMVDQIVNTTALSFVLATDELILERLATHATIHILESVEGFNLYDYSVDKHLSDQECLQVFEEREMRVCPKSRFSLIPSRLILTLVLMFLFIIEYYWHNCVAMDDGSVVSIPVALPPKAHMALASFFKRFLSWKGEHHELEPFWSMPGMDVLVHD